MGQTASSEGTKYQSPSHELTAIRESLRFLRERVRRIGESESPLLVFQIEKYEVRIRDLEETGAVHDAMDKGMPAKEETMIRAAGVNKGVIKKEEGPKIKRARTEGPAVAHKRTQDEMGDDLKGNHEVLLAELAAPPLKKVKVTEDEGEKRNRSPTFSLAKNIEVTREEGNTTDTNQISVKSPYSGAHKRSFDDMEGEIRKDVEGYLANLKEGQRQTKKAKITEGELEELNESQATSEVPDSAPTKVNEGNNTERIPGEHQAPTTAPKLVLKNTTRVSKKFSFVPRQCISLFNVTNSMRKPPTNKDAAPICQNTIAALKSKKAENLLREIPAEIRLKIFDNYFKTDSGKWKGRSPALVRALRVDQVIYPEIMEEFYKSDQEYHLNRRNGWSFCSMSDHAIKSIRKLRIEIKEYHAPPAKHPLRHWVQVPKPKKITKLYHKAINIESISIQSCIGGLTVGSVAPDVVKIFPEYLVNTKKLRSLDVDFRFIDAQDTYVIAFRRDVARMVNKLLGVDGVENRTEQLRRLRRRNLYTSVWYWDAPKGEILTQITRERMANRNFL